MNLTEEQLKEVETMAGLFFRPEDIMTILGIPVYDTSDFFETIEIKTEHPLYKAYHKGRLAALVELRTAIKQAALNGSNPAQGQMIEYFNKSML